MKSKKVSIITMHKVINFGSALQAWALQQTLCKLGHKCQIIDYKYPNEYYYTHCSKNQKRTFYDKISFSNLKRKLRNNILKIFYKRSLQKEKFISFWEENYNLTDTFNTIEEIRQASLQSDAYMTGSDQVWNPKTMFGDPTFFLAFGDSHALRISYASSFGCDKIPESFLLKYTRYLSRYDYLSVRETGGANIVKSILHKDIPVVCDPTLLLTKEDYDILSLKSNINIKKPYLLAYILDYAYNPYPVISSVIKQVSQKLNLQVVYLLCGNYNGYKLGSRTISSAGPYDFAKLFANASFVVTSSFHGTIFSLINNKSFYAITPSSKGDDRISSLLRIMELSDRGICAKSNFKLIDQQLNINYKKINFLINEERNKGLQFIKDCLS